MVLRRAQDRLVEARFGASEATQQAPRVQVRADIADTRVEQHGLQRRRRRVEHHPYKLPTFPPRQKGQYFVPTHDDTPLSLPPTYTFPSQQYTNGAASGPSQVDPLTKMQFGFDVSGADLSFALFKSLDLPSPQTFFWWSGPRCGPKLCRS
ncbi:hypothetical protein VNO77_04295 [Canavalia gladiata]|uniref:Uncharacterized protein n=1 Tax=Canavalia gladiata TaxID=3824 RepID=A0AAN9MWC3_CANGL